MSEPYYWPTKESLLLLLLGPLALYFALSNSTSESLPLLPLPESQVLQLEQITLQDYQKDFKRWTLTGLRALMAEDSSVMNESNLDCACILVLKRYHSQTR